jgi:hypothetical protein
VRCEGRWAIVDIDTCGGFQGHDSAYCDGQPKRQLLVVNEGRWIGDEFDQDAVCPDPVAFDVPRWVCEV